MTQELHILYPIRPICFPTSCEGSLATDAVSSFNGFYSRNGNFVIINPVRNLIALALAAGVALAALITGVILYVRRRRRSRAAVAVSSAGVESL